MNRNLKLKSSVPDYLVSQLKRPKQYRANRLCKMCYKKLSIYNPYNICFACHKTQVILDLNKGLPTDSKSNNPLMRQFNYVSTVKRKNYERNRKAKNKENA